MHTTNLRKVGGSIMLAVPPVLLNLLQLKAGATVAVDVENGRLIVEPKPRPRYTLAELLAESDYTQPQPAEEREWVDAPAVGGELL
jgi:antitoxin ChpS